MCIETSILLRSPKVHMKDVAELVFLSITPFSPLMDWSAITKWLQVKDVDLREEHWRGEMVSMIIFLCVYFHLQLLNVVKNFVFRDIEWVLTNKLSILNKSKLVLSSWYGFLFEIKEQEGEIKSSKACITHFVSIYQAECRVIAMDWFRPTRHPPRRDLLGKRYPISYIWIK